MTATITKLVTDRRPTKITRSRHYTKQLRRQTYTALGVAGVALVITALSLHHLATGVQYVTDCATWEAYAMAVATDLGFIGLELATVMATGERVRKEIARHAPVAIKGMLCGSAIMNAFGFGMHAHGLVLGGFDYMVIPAVLLGLVIPAFLYKVTRVGAALYVDCDSRR